MCGGVHCLEHRFVLEWRSDYGFSGVAARRTPGAQNGEVVGFGAA
jgi:hypothetical protein